MSWPHPPDYNEAIQNPKFCFHDPELQRGQPAVNALGLPWPRSGNHADVYKLECPGGQNWAVKCFTREVHDLRRRYQAISDHLRQAALPAMVEFQYQDEGIRIHGQWYPLVKMRWVDGLTLNELLREHADKPQVLERLAQLWLRLAQEMRQTRIAHGDLQHGNVLLVPGATPGTLRLRLVDYDGMVVPALEQTPSGEVGHPNYQHPQRLRDGTYDAEIDRFPHLLIYTTIRAVAVAGRPLWERHDNGENFLFREQDFQEPSKSALLRELNDFDDPEIRSLAGQLVLASIGPLERVPLLDEVAVNGTVRLLTEEERQQVTRCLAGKAAVQPEPSLVETAPINERVMPHHSPAGTATVILGPRKATWRGPYAPPPGRFGWSETLYRNGWRTAKRLTGHSRYGFTAALLTACAALGLAGLALLVTLMLSVGTFLFGSGKESAEAVEGDGPSATVPGLFLRPGEGRAIEVRIHRRGQDGPVEIRAEGLPEGVDAAPTTVVPPGDSGVLWLTAGPATRETVRQVEVVARIGERPLARTTLPLTVLSPEKWPWKNRQPLSPSVRLILPPPGPARLAPLPEVAVRVGKSLMIRVQLLREGKEGPLTLELENLPEGVRYRVLPVADDPDSLLLEIIAAAGASEGTKRVAARARLGGKPIEGGSLGLTVQVPRPPRPLPPADLILKAGDTLIIRVQVEREDHDGPIDVELHGLPDGVTCKPVTVPPGQNDVPVELKVAVNAPGAERQIEVWALVAGRKASKESFRVTVHPPMVRVSPPEPALPSEKITFATVDGVQLAGTWYPGAGGAESACILLLHQPGAPPKKEGWQRLAHALQKKGHAVLTFDFRGHGDSTRVVPTFWKHPVNRGLLIQDFFGTEEPAVISYKNFPANYAPMLVNDIAAARDFLDRKNDRQECNVSKLLLVGAGEGAALGAMWLFAEWHRFQLTSPQPLLLSASPEGRHVAGAVWLSIRPQLGGRFCRAEQWLRVAGSGRRAPMGFLHGDGDETSTSFARQCLREIKPAGLIQKLTAENAIRDTALAGETLLEKIPATDTAIVNYVATVLQTVPRPAWSPRSSALRTFYWRFPNATPLLAKSKGETLLHLAPLERLQRP